MPDRYPQLTGFVLAGGASRRMGQPKHALRLDDEMLLTRAVRAVESVARTVAVLGPAERADGLTELLRRRHVTVIPDDVPGRGPLGAILTGLNHTRTEFNLMVSCDLPFMSARFLRYLVDHALDSLADVTLTATPQDGYQALTAVYRRRARAAIRGSLNRGHNRITRFFRNVDVRLLPWPDVARAGFQPFIFDNLNTPDDYDRAVRRAANTMPR